MYDSTDSQELPDIASQPIQNYLSPLDWVGMNQVVLPIQLQTPSAPHPLEASVQIYVNLHNPTVKGIHMSRLYLLLTEYAQANLLSTESLTHFLSEALASHEDISSQATISFKFQYLVKQPALKSQYSGWKGYSSGLTARYMANAERADIEMYAVIPYSSTCPCSAALARQKVQQKFSSDFIDKEAITKSEVEAWLRSENGTYATPHSQRSHAKVRVKLADHTSCFDFKSLINQVESRLKTPVQTAVKREDEQAFAELNGQNLMFCEDAARKLKSQLSKETQYADFWIRVEHYESLHAHDAVSIATKGITNGYQTLPIDSFY